MSPGSLRVPMLDDCVCRVDDGAVHIKEKALKRGGDRRGAVVGLAGGRRLLVDSHGLVSWANCTAVVMGITCCLAVV